MYIVERQCVKNVLVTFRLFGFIFFVRRCINVDLHMYNVHVQCTMSYNYKRRYTKLKQEVKEIFFRSCTCLCPPSIG